MRKLFLLFSFLLCLNEAFAQANLSVENFDIKPGETKKIAISMTNDAENVISVGGFVVLPEGLSFVDAYLAGKKRTYMKLSGRTVDHSVSPNLITDTKLKFVVVSMTESPISGTSGDLLYVTVKADENVSLGKKAVTLEEIKPVLEGNIELLQETFTATVNIYSEFNVSVSSADEKMGIVKGESGTIKSGTDITVTATANEGYHFVKWSNDVIENPYTFTVNADADLTATFAPNQYTVEFKDGETSVSSEHDYASVITAPATPSKEGHTFEGWFNGEEQFAEGATVPVGGVTYTAKYTKNTYKVQYTLEGVNFGNPVEVLYGEAIPEAPTATGKEGYKFAGWTGVPETMPAKNVTINGTYTINSYELTFKVDGEAFGDPQTVEYNSPIKAPTIEEKEGHTFSWGEYPANMPAYHLTVEGAYTPNTYKLTYVIDSEEFSKEVDVVYGTTIEAISAPEKEGYTFDGWVGVPETMPADDVEVTGSYTINQYTVTFVADGETVKEYTLDYGTEIVAPEAPAKEGHTFSWGEYPANMPASDLVIEGAYTPNTYTLTYVIDGEEFSEEVDVVYGTTIEAIAAPEKEGYTFDGWVGVPETMPDVDVEVTGSYTINKYTVKFVVAIEGQEEEVVYNEPLEYGSTIEAPAGPDKLDLGLLFNGWYLGEEQFEVGTTVPAHDVTYTALYIGANLTVHYFVDGEPYKDVTVAYGAAIEPLDEQTKTGYTFSGWSEIPATMPAKDVDVYGTFTINQYSVKFIADGVVVSEQSLDYGTVINAPQAPAKEGHTFSSWGYVDKTVPAYDVTYTAKYNVNYYTITYVVDEDTYYSTLVAYGSPVNLIADAVKTGHVFSGWSEAPATMPAHDITVTGYFVADRYMVTFVIDGEVVRERILEYGSEIKTPAVPEIEGYTFVGWNNGFSGYVPAYDVTYSPVYAPNVYTLTYYVDGEVYAVYEVEYGAEIEPEEAPEPENEDYVFSGWSEIPATMPIGNVDVYGTFSNGPVAITDAALANGKVKVYTLGGVRVNATRVKDLKAGAYIVNGKKLVVK